MTHDEQIIAHLSSVADAAAWARGYLESAAKGPHNETGPEFAIRMLAAWNAEHPIMRRAAK